jgi:hypothetical protein
MLRQLENTKYETLADSVDRLLLFFNGDLTGPPEHYCGPQF